MRRLSLVLIALVAAGGLASTVHHTDALASNGQPGYLNENCFNFAGC